MGTGDYICVTLRGGAPWGFTLREGEGDFYRPFLVSQVEEGGRAFLAGVQDGDEVVSLNGEPCADLTLLRAHALIESSIDCLQLLVKRDCSNTSENLESEEAYGGDALMSTTLHILSPKQEPQSPRELFFTGSHDGGYYRGGPQLHASSSDDQDPAFKETDNEVQRCFSPGVMVEVQLSLSKQTLGCTSLGSAHGIEGELSKREASDTIRPPATSHDAPCSAREPFGQRGVVLGSPSMLQQVEVTLKQPAASAAGRGILSVEGGAGGPGVSESGGSQSGGEEGGGGGHGEEVPGTFSVSFRIPSEEATQAEEQDSDSEGDPDKPNKHRARHARLRRSESQSEKQVKEAKSKCKRIALLLTAAPPNPNNKGVLMFKKHRQRAKKYTLVSYGTGEDGQEYSGEEDDEDPDEKQGIHAVEFTLAARNLSELDKHFLTDAHNSKGVLTINWDKGLLEIERNLINQEQMECLPDTKGKGALMFAQRRLRMDEISAEHEELRSQGIPVEGMQEAVKDKVEPSYMQSTTEDQAYMDVNIHQQSQQQQHHQQYQEQQYYEQQQHYQQQQQYQQQYQQQQQLQQYEQQHYQQQQQQHMYQQQQEYHQQQQQIQQYSVNNNGTVQHQTNEMQSSFSNRTAKPFSAESVPAAPYYPAMSGADQDSMGQGEQIASRDERISTPASRTGLLDSKGRNIGKPMFTFKDAPKVSPNPALLNLLNRSDKKLVFESGPEEDYLSLGAEACNFLQSSRIKHKNPPPVAPKPMINPNTAPWSSQIEVPNQDMPQHAENSVSTSAVAPTIETTPSAELEPAPAPAPEPSPLQAPIEAPASTTTEEQHKWTPTVPETQQQQVIVQGENGQLNASPQPETAPMRTWAPAQPQAQQEPSPISWHPAQVQPQVTPQSQSPPQPPWVTRQPPPSQVQTQPQTNNWTPQVQSSWIQPQEQAQAQTHAQQSWAQPQAQAQVQPPWIHTNEPHMQQMQPNRGQPQEMMQQQQSQASWAQPPQADPNHQPPWVQQTQQKSQTQPPWVQQSQPETQPQPPWAQPSQYQAPQQAWPQAQASGQPQPQWDSAQPQLQQQQQPSINAWPPTQTQAQPQPPWIQTPQAQPPTQPTANLNPWAPVPAQAQSQPSWAQQPPEHGQQPMNSWGAGQGQAQQPQPWVQPVPPQPTPQPNWQQAPPQAPPQPTMGTWSPAQTPPQPPANAWAPQSHQSPVNTAPSMNTQPSPKPWHPPQNASQNRSPPPPPQRTNSYHYSQRTSPLINPMATVLNPSSAGSAYEMPAVKGKGADMFAKRQSRMEKYVVDSETVQANKASRSTSPAPSLPNEWKYTPNVRAPPSRAYNPIQSPSYPPAATKQPPPSSSSSKANKKGKEEQKPAPKPLNVIDVMKHQPYQLNSSLFIYGPAVEALEAAKDPSPKPACSPPNPPVENQPIRYEQMTPVQPAAPFNAPYPQQAYGMPMQPMMHDGHYQQTPNVYPPSIPYQQLPAGPYQQAYNQQYQQPAPSAYQPQAPPSSNPAYQPPQVHSQQANSPPYLAAPSVPYQQQQPPVNVAPSFLAAPPESTSGGNPVAAPKPRFTAKKSSAQALGRSYSLSPPARVTSKGRQSGSSSPRPQPRVSGQTPWLEKVHKPLTPWEAASRHPLGLVDEAFAFQNLQQNLASNVHLAAQRKRLPEPPPEWKARVSYQAPPKTGSQTWSRAPLPSFVSPTKSAVPNAARDVHYGSLPRQWQSHRPPTGATSGPSPSSFEHKRPLGKQTYKPVYGTNTTWSWRR